MTISRSSWISAPPLLTNLLNFSEHFSALIRALSASGNLWGQYHTTFTSGWLYQYVGFNEVLFQVCQSLSNNTMCQWELIEGFRVRIMWCHVTTRGEQYVTPLCGVHQCLFMQVLELLVSPRQLDVHLCQNPVYITMHDSSEGSRSYPMFNDQIRILK